MDIIKSKIQSRLESKSKLALKMKFLEMEKKAEEDPDQYGHFKEALKLFDAIKYSRDW